MPACCEALAERSCACCCSSIRYCWFNDAETAASAPAPRPLKCSPLRRYSGWPAFTDSPSAASPALTCPPLRAITLISPVEGITTPSSRALRVYWPSSRNAAMASNSATLAQA